LPGRRFPVRKVKTSQNRSRDPGGERGQSASSGEGRRGLARKERENPPLLGVHRQGAKNRSQTSREDARSPKKFPEEKASRSPFSWQGPWTLGRGELHAPHDSPTRPMLRSRGVSSAPFFRGGRGKENLSSARGKRKRSPNQHGGRLRLQRKKTIPLRQKNGRRTFPPRKSPPDLKEGAFCGSRSLSRESVQFPPKGSEHLLKKKVFFRTMNFSCPRALLRGKIQRYMRIEGARERKDGRAPFLLKKKQCSPSMG